MSGEYIISGFLTICLIIASYEAYKAYKKVKNNTKLTKHSCF